MEIFYRKIGCESEFQKLNNNEKIDLNSNILKIISENKILSITIDEEIIENNTYSNEIICYKYRTTNKKNIKILAKVNRQNNRSGIENKTIRLIEDTAIYDSRELEVIRITGKKAIKRIIEKSNEENENVISDFIENIEIDIKKLIKLYETIKKIIKYSKNILLSPKVDLRVEEIIKKSNEVKKITASSARFFIVHPEYWYSEGDLTPKPLELLTEDFEEIKDIYENRVIKLILDKGLKITSQIIIDLKIYIGNLNSLKLKQEAELILENKKVDLNIQEENLKNGKDLFQKFNYLSREIKYILNELKEVKLDNRMKIKVTQKILYDKRYYQSLMLYKKFLEKYEIIEKRKITLEYENSYNYIFIIAELIQQIMIGHGLYEYKVYIGENNIENQNLSLEEIIVLFNKGKQIIIESKHQSTLKEFKYRMILNNRMDKEKGHIELEIKYGDEFDKTKIFINSEFREKNITLEEIENIIERFYVSEQETRLIFNTVKLTKIKNKSSEEHLKSIFKISNLGNNFLSAEEYEKYGDYKLGMVPLNLESIQEIYYKLLNLIKIKFLKLNMFEKCTFCGIGTLDKNGELLICNHCRKRIAINKCKKCGGEIIKILSKNSNMISINEKLESREYHREYEIKSIFLGSCYKYPYSNSGGFCSKCGYCDGKDKSCVRCRLFKSEGK